MARGALVVCGRDGAGRDRMGVWTKEVEEKYNQVQACLSQANLSSGLQRRRFGPEGLTEEELVPQT